MGKTNYNEIKVAAARTALFNNIKDVQDEINIHDVLKLSSGENLPTHKMIDGNYPVFGGGGETGLTHNIFNVDFETLAIGRVGARCGCVFKVPKKSWVTDNALYALSFDKRFLLDFLIHYLSYVDLNQYANRAAQPVISLKRISSINFPLIDVEKQKAFIEIIEQVEKGETYFGNEYSELNNALKSVDRIDELQDELTYQLTQLENLNQAILQEAVQGKLVKAPSPLERAGGEVDEPASELLKRIKAEKAKSSKKEKLLPPIKPEEIPFEIPENWVWCRLGEIANLKSGNQYQLNSTDSGIMYVKVGDMNNSANDYEIKISSTYYAINDVNERDLIPKNSIIFPKRGGAIATNKRRVVLAEQILVDSNTMAVTPEYCIDFKYFFFWFSNIDLSKLGNDGVIPQVNNKDIDPLLFPLPPLSEQKRIVEEIEKQFAKTKQLSEHIIANQQATEQLLKALLHQAFEVKEVEEV